MVGEERVARSAERLGNGEVTVLYPRLDLVGRDNAFFGNVVMNFTVFEISVFVDCVKRVIELFSKFVLLFCAVHFNNEVIAEIACRYSTFLRILRRNSFSCKHSRTGKERNCAYCRQSCNCNRFSFYFHKTSKIINLFYFKSIDKA